MNCFFKLFFTFIIYAFTGWLIESIYCMIVDKKTSNRGFLIGPYCPVYGLNAMALIFLLTNYQKDIIVLFGMSILISSIIEYLTSYIMEKTFKARWWDYSKKAFNLNGRICLKNSLMFGILGVLLIEFIAPFINSTLNSLNVSFLNIISLILLLVFTTDFIISFNIIFNLKKTAEVIKKDYTDEITEKVRNALRDRSYFFKRLLNAFPNYRLINKKRK